MSTDSARDPRDAERLSTLLRQVHRLELVARHNAHALRTGEWTTAVRGRGMVFHETRKYVQGEPARRIDWNITARLGEPHVRVHLEERQRNVLLALDVSPSMHDGFQRRTKLEYAVELAATLAVSAIDAGDRLGVVLFADRVLDERRALGGRAQLFRVLRTLIEHTAPWQRAVAESDPRAAIHAIERQGGRSVVFLISDFVDHDVPTDIDYLRPRHDVSLLHIVDPVEYDAASPIVIGARSPEGDAPRTPIRFGAVDSLDALRADLRDRCGALGMAFESFPTDGSVRSALGHFFHQKRGLRARAG
ncbi:MAG: DUF58 domain-containing protein [Acidobacteriota bacterium]